MKPNSTANITTIVGLLVKSSSHNNLSPTEGLTLNLKIESLLDDADDPLVREVLKSLRSALDVLTPSTLQKLEKLAGHA